MATDKAAGRFEIKFAVPYSMKKCWSAVGNPDEFGYWFGASFEGTFVQGNKIPAKIAPTQVDPVVAEKQQPFAGTPFVLWIAKARKYRTFNIVWQPGVPGADQDPARRIHTEVKFQFSRGWGKTWVRIAEEGFEKLPDEIRETVIADNKRGWEIQSRLFTQYLEMKYPKKR